MEFLLLPSAVSSNITQKIMFLGPRRPGEDAPELFFKPLLRIAAASMVTL
jgi:hypothetical protein